MCNLKSLLLLKKDLVSERALKDDYQLVFCNMAT